MELIPPQVTDHDQGWVWTLVYFKASRGIRNELKDMYLIPLSSGAMITPGGPLEEGTYIYIKDEPVLSPNTAVIFIVRPLNPAPV